MAAMRRHRRWGGIGMARNPLEGLVPGRVVRYVPTESEWALIPRLRHHPTHPMPYPAMVTEVHGPELLLTVFFPFGPQVKPEVSYSDEPKPGTWHWPPR